MKFTCLQENLVRGLSIVGRAVSVKNSLPVLSNVLIQTDSGRLKLSATNLETSITTWIGASVDEDGAITVPSRLLYEFVSNLPPASIAGELDGTTLKLKSDKASSRFNGVEASEFPEIPDDSEGLHLSIDPKIFSEAVLESAFAAAFDESRPVLTGVLVTLDKNSLSLVGVDGFRLAQRLVALDGKSVKKTFSAVIPAKTLLEIARLVSSFEGSLDISLNKDGNLVVFTIGDVFISLRTIDGEFPEYKKLIPEKSKGTTSAKVSSKDFVNALKLANVFAKEALSVVKIKVSPKDGAIYVLSSSSELGENNSRVEAEVDGKELETAFNSKFILDALGNIKSEEFMLEFPENIGPGVPGVLRPIGRDNHLYLVMPLQY